MSILVQVMSWHQTGDKPLQESIMTQLTNTYIDGLVQERRNSIANALDLRLSCTNPSICFTRPKLDKLERPFWEYPPQ